MDNYYHLHWAWSIAEGNIFGDTTYFRAPFYVYCLAALQAALGASLWVARGFGLLIGLGSILMTYALGRRVFGHRAGLFAALLHAVYPWIMYFESELLLDSLFTLLMQAGLYLYLVWLNRLSHRLALATGLIIGLAAITRPTILILLPLLLIFAWRARPAPKSRVLAVLLLLVGVSSPIVPIFVRNLVVASDPVLISSQGGVNFFIGNNAWADGVSAVMPEPWGHNWRIEDITHIAERDLGRQLRPGDISSYWYKRGVAWITDHPRAFAGLAAKKVYYNVADREISNNRSLPWFSHRHALLRYNPLSFGIIFPLAVLGVLLRWRENRMVKLLALAILCYVALTALFFFNSRFRLPLMPLYIVLATGGLTALVPLFRRSPSRAAATVVFVLAVMAVSFIPLVSDSSQVGTQDLLSKGLMYYQRGDYATAVSHYRQAIGYNPEYPTTNLNLGLCFLRLGQADSARYYFEREITFHPGRAEAYINIASLHLVNRRFDSAMIAIAEAIERRPYDITANLVLLRAAAENYNDIGPLIDLVHQAAARTRNDLFVLNEAGVLLLSRQAEGPADSVLRLALSTAPPPIETDNTAFDAVHRYSRENFLREKARSYYQLGFLRGRQGSFEQAIDYLSLIHI